MSLHHHHHVEGGCLCGRVRYRLTAPLTDVAYCHCRMCQKASGAPAMVFGTIHEHDFKIIDGDPKGFQSSDFGERWFCGDCGAHIAMRVVYQPTTVDIAVATLDDPTLAPPSFHIWRHSRIDWFETADELPRYEDRGPDGDRAAAD